MEHCCQQTIMHFAELIIIYLAYGAPFGVYDLSCSRKKPSLADLHLTAAKFIFWPVLVGSWVRTWFLRGRRRELGHLENDIEVLREQLERTAFCDGSAETILGFREVYARYTGLTLFLQSGLDRQYLHPIFEFRQDAETKAAAACLYRRDRGKVALHQRQARAEFLDLMGRLSGAPPENDDLILGAVEVATLLQDPACTNALYSLFPDDRVAKLGTPMTFPKTAN
jgi:hypothetical protein